MADAEVLTVKEYAAKFRLHEKSVYRLIARGKIPAQRIGGALRIVRSIQHVSTRFNRPDDNATT